MQQRRNRGESASSEHQAMRHEDSRLALTHVLVSVGPSGGAVGGHPVVALGHLVQVDGVGHVAVGLDPPVVWEAMGDQVGQGDRDGDGAGTHTQQ